MPGLSVIVITRNEESNLAEALESVAWADEIVVVDAESTDRTREVALRFTDRVVVRPWNGYIEQKNFAAGAASHDWILSLDADERISSGLAGEIRALLASGPEAPGYRMPRVTKYLGRWIRTTDWYPDYQLRLYDRRGARWHGRYVHESVTVEGRIAYLKGEIEHHAYRDVAHHLEKMNVYSSLAARQLHEQGRRATMIDLFGHPPFALLRNLVLRRGFLDGGVGALVSLLNSYYVFLKFAKLWELDQSARQHDASSASGTPIG